MNIHATSKLPVQYIIQATGLFWLLAKIMSWKLWLANRAFPVVPLFDFLDATPHLVHIFLFIVSLSCLVFIIIKPQQYYLLLIVIVSELLSCSLDQNRWQPWQYQYLFMFFVVWYNRKQPIHTIILLLIIFASTYFYSGLHKINPHFIRLMWQSTFLEKVLHLPNHWQQNNSLLRLGYMVPLFEMILGLSLLFKKTRKPALVTAIVMHILLLCFIGPLGINYNKIVWPWNAAMVAFCIIILKNKNEIHNFKYAPINFNYIVILAWVVLPILNIWGYWDSYFSSSLYTGKNKICYIKIHQPPANFVLSAYYLKNKSTDDTTVKTIPLHKWAIGEMGTPPCPQERVFKKIKEKWAKQFYNIDATFLMVDKSAKEKKIIKI